MIQHFVSTDEHEIGDVPALLCKVHDVSFGERVWEETRRQVGL